MKKTPLLYMFAFFDGLLVAIGSIIGFLNPFILTNILGPDFTEKDIIWFKFILLPGFSINVLYLFFAITKNNSAIFISNILRILTTIGFYLIFIDESVKIKTLLFFMMMHHVIFVAITFLLYFKKSKNKNNLLNNDETVEENLTEN